ncbi:MAG: histidinol dehydrogenase [Actinomycetota bacterium]
MSRLRHLTAVKVRRERRSPVDAATLADAAAIVEDVRRRGEEAVREHSERLGDLSPGDVVVLDRGDLEASLDSMDLREREALERAAFRVDTFARQQRACLLDLDTDIDGGRAGHRWTPVNTAGAYAPGGRYPLPSSVLMTVIPARIAGVQEVWVASPKPTPVTLAAAAIADADGLIAAGGAQAIASLAFGTFSPPSDVIVGPGNRWVTAAKKHLVGEVGIDGLAGPSEIVVVADRSADPRLVAADLLAQAEHDTDALPILISTSDEVADEVDGELEEQLLSLPTAPIAAAALEGGFAVAAVDLDEAIDLCNHLAPEHLSLHVENAASVADRFTSYGSLFVGDGSAEAFADYGAGPNHVLPTGGGARYQSGLSVATFLRSPTWMTLTAPGRLTEDAATLARLEGLEAHARSAELRGSRRRA